MEVVAVQMLLAAVVNGGEGLVDWLDGGRLARGQASYVEWS